MAKAECVVNVYMDDGNVFYYTCPADKGREHAHAIVSGGYARTVDGNLTLYGPNRVRKVVVVGGQSTMYSDNRRGI